MNSVVSFDRSLRASPPGKTWRGLDRARKDRMQERIEPDRHTQQGQGMIGQVRGDQGRISLIAGHWTGHGMAG